MGRPQDFFQGLADFYRILAEIRNCPGSLLAKGQSGAWPSIYEDTADLKVNASSKARSGPEVLPRCQATNKSQVAPVSAMGTMTTFPTHVWSIMKND
jgi:hypothetical protein